MATKTKARTRKKKAAAPKAESIVTIVRKWVRERMQAEPDVASEQLLREARERWPDAGFDTMAAGPWNEVYALHVKRELEAEERAAAKGGVRISRKETAAAESIAGDEPVDPRRNGTGPKLAPDSGAPARIPLGEIVVVSNPRKHFDQKKLEELAASIREEGLIQPILVRPVTPAEHEAWALQSGMSKREAKDAAAGARYELVAGERRLRAHRLAGLEEIRATIRTMSAEKAAELRLIENLHREDLHELEEAQAFRELIDSGRYSPEQLGERCGRSLSYVYQRLKLLELTPAAQKAFLEGRITAGHAIELARLTPEHQAEALQETLRGGVHWVEGDTMSVRALRAWISRNVHLDLHSAPFKMDDEELVPGAGSCAMCPKRTGFVPDLFPDVAKGETCTDRHCFRSKVAATIERRAAELKAEGTSFVRVSTDNYLAPSEKKATGAKLRRHEYREISERKDRCDQVETALIVHGDRAGEVIEICRRDGCTKHGGGHSYEPSEEQKRRERWTRERGKRDRAYREKLLEEVAEALAEWPPKPGFLPAATNLVLYKAGSEAKKRTAKLLELEPGGKHCDSFDAALRAYLQEADAVRTVRVMLHLLLQEFAGTAYGNTTQRLEQVAELAGVDPAPVMDAVREASRGTLPEDALGGSLEVVRWGENTSTYWDDRTPHVVDPKARGRKTLCKLKYPEDADVTEPHHNDWPRLCGNCERKLVRLETSAQEDAA